MRLTLQLPVPSMKLRSNGSFGNGFVYRKAFREAKATAIREAERVLSDAGIGPPRWARAGYVITQFHASPQRLDPDNLIACCKAYLDGIAAAGIVLNDKYLFPERPCFLRVNRLPRIEIEVFELDNFDQS